MSRQFRELVLARYPGLAICAAYRLLFAYLVFPPRVEASTGYIPIPMEVLASAQGAMAQLKARNFNGAAFLERYQHDTGHQLEVIEYCYQVGFARAVRDVHLDEELQRARLEELQRAPDSTVSFVTGHPVTWRQKAQRAEADALEPTAYQSRFPETQDAIDYLNSIPASRARQAMTRCLTRALSHAIHIPDRAKSLRDLMLLRHIYEQPKQYYQASLEQRTRRIFPRYPGYVSLSKGTAACFGGEWWEHDLRSSQLMICAYTWPVPELIAFLETGTSIWRELLPYLGVDAQAKPTVKHALYALTYGAGNRRITDEFEHGLSSQIGVAASRALGKRFLAHPLMASMYRARDRQLASIRAAGGAYDCYGVWIPSSRAPEPRGEITSNPRSVLAQLAQAYEFKILSPVFELAKQTDRFYITHWAHDGFSVDIVDLRRADATLRRIRDAVARQADQLGIRTELECTRDPRMSSSA